MRVPRKDAALHEIIKEAHKIVECKVSHQDEYEEALRSETARLVEAHPVFWARVWPAGLALARFVIAKPTLVAGTNTLEIGAGLGPGAIAAALAGATRVVATDIEPKALDFVAQSARDNSVAVETAAWDWNQRPPPLARGPFDVILAGDVTRYRARALMPSSAVKQAGLLPSFAPCPVPCCAHDMALPRPSRFLRHVHAGPLPQ